MPDADWWQALWPDPAQLIADLGVRAETSVADLCAGDGWFTVEIARVAGTVTAIDIDPALLDVARARLAAGGLANCSFVEADAFDIDRCVAGPVDYVLAANIFHGVPDKAGLARAIGRALKPGGLFGVVNWDARPREKTEVLGAPRGPATALRMAPEAMVAAAEAAGFAHAFTTRASPYHYGVVFRWPGADATTA